MAEFIPVIKTEELPEGEMKKVDAGGKAILVARIKGKYYAMDNRCAHAGGDLSAGLLEGNIVTCPRHASQWNVTTGKNVRWTRKEDAVPKTDRLAIYPVKVEGGDILVGV